MSGRPLEVVRCITQDIMVPAEAEIVIEGSVPIDTLEMEGSFGEFPGYMAQRDYSFFMDVTAITMRRQPIYLSIISQMPPSESSKMRNIGRAAAGIRLLRRHSGKTLIKRRGCWRLRRSLYRLRTVKMLIVFPRAFFAHGWTRLQLLESPGSPPM